VQETAHTKIQAWEGSGYAIMEIWIVEGPAGSSNTLHILTPDDKEYVVLADDITLAVDTMTRKYRMNNDPVPEYVPQHKHKLDPLILEEQLEKSIRDGKQYRPLN